MFQAIKRGDYRRHLYLLNRGLTIVANYLGRISLNCRAGGQVRLGQRPSLAMRQRVAQAGQRVASTPGTGVVEGAIADSRLDADGRNRLARLPLTQWPTQSY